MENFSQNPCVADGISGNMTTSVAMNTNISVDDAVADAVAAAAAASDVAFNTTSPTTSTNVTIIDPIANTSSEDGVDIKWGGSASYGIAPFKISVVDDATNKMDRSDHLKAIQLTQSDDQINPSTDNNNTTSTNVTNPNKLPACPSTVTVLGNDAFKFAHVAEVHDSQTSSTNTDNATLAVAATASATNLKYAKTVLGNESNNQLADNNAHTVTIEPNFQRQRPSPSSPLSTGRHLEARSINNDSSTNTNLSATVDGEKKENFEELIIVKSGIKSGEMDVGRNKSQMGSAMEEKKSKLEMDEDENKSKVEMDVNENESKMEIEASSSKDAAPLSSIPVKDSRTATSSSPSSEQNHSTTAEVQTELKLPSASISTSTITATDADSSSIGGNAKRKRRAAAISAAAAVAATIAGDSTNSINGDFYSHSHREERERELEKRQRQRERESKRVKTTSDRIADGSSTSNENTEKAATAIRFDTANNKEVRAGASAGGSSSRVNTSQKKHSSMDEIVSLYVVLPPLNSNVPPLPLLSQRELVELETALGIESTSYKVGNSKQINHEKDEDDENEEITSWPEDWSGNLALSNKEIYNPGSAIRNRYNATSSSSYNNISNASSLNNGTKKSVLNWAQDGNRQCLKILHYLIRYVYHFEGTPASAKQILASANPTSFKDIENAVRRVLYDPTVLREDGWTTAKSKHPVGATGGPYRIGEMIRWQNFDAVVIAYIHDVDMGDLWRAIWIDEGVETFDLEAEELAHAKKMWDKTKRQSQKLKQHSSVTNNSRETSGTMSNTSSITSIEGAGAASRRTNRFLAEQEFTVPGIKYGIVLAASYSRGARVGVYWPARIMHASETEKSGKRSSAKQRLDVVFLAPYWNSEGLPVVSSVKPVRRAEPFPDSLSKQAESKYYRGPLFDIENIEASEEMIKEYPYHVDNGVDVDQLRVAFRFTGLPKAAFPRFLDSHRLAMGLKAFAHKKLLKLSSLTSASNSADLASAGLFDTHPMSVQVPMFPIEVLQLPFQFILSQLPRLPLETGEVEQQLLSFDNEQTNIEPILQLDAMLDAMRPPNSWGQNRKAVTTNNKEPMTPTMDNRISGVYSGTQRKSTELLSASPAIALLNRNKDTRPSVELDYFISDLAELKDLLQETSLSVTTSPLDGAFKNLKQLLSSLSGHVIRLDSENKKERRTWSTSLINLWGVTKSLGEEALSTPGFFSGSDARNLSKIVLVQWRRACERIFKFITYSFSLPGYGDGVSVVLTDSRCNEHITSCGCFERPVRIPAALKAVKEFGAGSKDEIQLITSIADHYVNAVEKNVLIQAHSASYLKRMKGRCSAIKGNQVVPLTEDSAGNGGEDTKGSRGTWKAAVVSVGAATKAVDMVVRGECVNAFCITRPPGHHAGRELHPMKAISNGFCILNTVACAALHATTPISKGGTGLKRVCIVDFDVHHGNGTQEILCSTYDPRFLYVSMHAGGAHVNGLPTSDDLIDKEIHSPGGQTLKGIFPGRCGDTSPHDGVLNIPLGPRVTSHAVGTALISQVTPAVDSFSPDLIILSAGFDAHKNDPLGLGGLSAEDFGHITDALCQLAFKCCSGRLISVLEGGYGVPCCRPQEANFLPSLASQFSGTENGTAMAAVTAAGKIDLGNGSNSFTQKQQHDEAAKTQSSSNKAPNTQISAAARQQQQRPQPSKLLDLGDNIPAEMDDQVPYALQRRLERCHAEGFVDCIKAHVQSLAKCNKRS